LEAHRLMENMLPMQDVMNVTPRGVDATNPAKVTVAVAFF
jgi:hypothetical protein